MTAETWVALAGLGLSFAVPVFAAWRSLKDRVAALDFQLSQIDREVRNIGRWFELSGPDNSWLSLPERVRGLEQRLDRLERKVG